MFPFVVMHDNAHSLHSLLLFYHPGTAPEPQASLDQPYRLYRIADKYMIDSLKVWLRRGVRWEMFLTDYSKALAEVPCFEKAPLAELYRKVTKETGKCETCGPIALNEISRFLEKNKESIMMTMNQKVRINVSGFSHSSYCTFI